MYIQAITKIYLHFRPFHLPSSSFHLVSTPLMLYKMENAVHCIRGASLKRSTTVKMKKTKIRTHMLAYMMILWECGSPKVIECSHTERTSSVGCCPFSCCPPSSACGLIIRRHNHAVQSDCPEIAARSHTTRLSSSKQSEIETMITKLALASSK